MRLYVGQTRSAELVRRLWLLGIGECTARGELPPRRRPWFYDNGAFKDWTAGKPFDAEEFLRDMDAIYRSIDRPEWIVLPDRVAGGLDSLAFSERWVHRCRGLAPLYLAVQDGMRPADVEPMVRHLAGVFVGGTLKWKIRAAREWAAWARERELRCHVGRVGTPRRVQWAQRIGVDSIDSALPLWSEDKLRRFLDALDPAQRALALEAA